MFRAHAIAGYRYRPEPIPDKLFLFRASERDTRIADDPQNGWHGLAGKVIVETLAGSHKSIMIEPQVLALASAIESCLRHH